MGVMPRGRAAPAAIPSYDAHCCSSAMPIFLEDASRILITSWGVHVKNRTLRRTVLLTLGFGLTVNAVGAGVEQVATLTSETALQAATSAEDACLKMGFRVSVTVVDAAGNVLVTVRQDGASPHTVSTSQRKAYTALSSRMPTTQLTKIVGGNPDAFGMREIEGFLVLSGGIPIKSGESVVGAIGVSGSPGPDNDDKCAGAGISTIAGKLGK